MQCQNIDKTLKIVATAEQQTIWIRITVLNSIAICRSTPESKCRFGCACESHVVGVSFVRRCACKPQQRDREREREKESKWMNETHSDSCLSTTIYTKLHWLIQRCFFIYTELIYVDTSYALQKKVWCVKANKQQQPQPNKRDEFLVSKHSSRR